MSASSVKSLISVAWKKFSKPAMRELNPWCVLIERRATAPLLPAPPSPSDFAAFAQRMHSEMYALKTRIDALESGVLVGSKRRRMDSEEARYGRRSSVDEQETGTDVVTPIGNQDAGEPTCGP